MERGVQTINVYVQDHKFVLSKDVLIEHMGYFRSLFNLGMKESNDKDIILHDPDPYFFSVIYDFIIRDVLPEDILRDIDNHLESFTIPLVDQIIYLQCDKMLKKIMWFYDIDFYNHDYLKRINAIPFLNFRNEYSTFGPCNNHLECIVEELGFMYNLNKMDSRTFKTISQYCTNHKKIIGRDGLVSKLTYNKRSKQTKSEKSTLMSPPKFQFKKKICEL